MHGIWGSLMMGLFWLVVIVGVVLLVKWINDNNQANRPRETDDSPEEILRKRYARGEITKQEFEARKQDLG